MEEIYQKLSVVNLWQGFKNSEVTTFNVIEVWLQHDSRQVNTIQRLVHFKELDSWLAEGTNDDGDTKQSLVSRIALIGCDIKSRTLKLSSDVMSALLDAFDLKLAYKYSQSCVTNVAAIPPLSSERQAYSFCYMPKLAAVWAHHRFDADSQSDRPYLTQGLIFLDESNMKFLSEIFCTSWSTLLYESPMFPAFLLCLFLSTQIHQMEEKIKVKMRASEAFASFKTPMRTYDQAIMSLFVSLAAEADGCAVKLGSLSRKSKMVDKALKFILKSISEQDSNGNSPKSISTEACQLLRSHVVLLQDRLEMQVVDMEYTLKRVQLQAGMLAGIISRGDFQATLTLAEFQQRDSLSMKTLAIVTMVFLPGSFVSALFSTSMFDWDSVDPSSNSIAVRPLPQFRLYWAITIPLTIATFLLFFFWLWITKNQHTRQKEQGDAMRRKYFGQTSDEEKGEAGLHRMKSRKDTGLSKRMLTMLSGSW